MYNLDDIHSTEMTTARQDQQDLLRDDPIPGSALDFIHREFDHLKRA